MALRDEIKKMVGDELAKTDIGLRSWVAYGPVAFKDPGEAALMQVQYTRAVLEGVYRLADEIDALRADLEER